MLYLVGLGLGDAKDITVKGLEIVKKAEYVFLEAYTSILCVGKEALVGVKSTSPYKLVVIKDYESAFDAVTLIQIP